MIYFKINRRTKQACSHREQVFKASNSLGILVNQRQIRRGSHTITVGQFWPAIELTMQRSLTNRKIGR